MSLLVSRNIILTKIPGGNGIWKSPKIGQIVKGLVIELVGIKCALGHVTGSIFTTMFAL